MISITALVLLLGAAGTPETASSAPAAIGPAEASSPASAKVQKVAADKSRIRCKSYRPTNTRFDKRTCKTISEWEHERELAREAAKDIQNQPQICITGASGCPGGGE